MNRFAPDPTASRQTEFTSGLIAGAAFSALIFTIAIAAVILVS